MNRLFGYVAVALAILLVIAVGSCSRPTEPAHANNPPDTRLANIPKDNDTVFALVTLYWDGGDYDGFIKGYQYRYFTYHLLPGTGQWIPFDSTAWKDTTGSSVTIPFNSTDSLNRQEFFVRAVDNDRNIDPTPAKKVLTTTRTAPPITKLITPAKNAIVLASQQVTDWWPGVPVTFNAKDQAVQGAIVGYAWSVDDGPFTWTTDTTVNLSPSVFKAPLNGPHKIKVTSRNNTNLVDPVGDSSNVTLIVPTFEKKILIIDETDEFNSPFITMKVSDATVDSFYARVFPGSDSWDFKAKGMPPREVLAQYKLLVWHADDVPVSRPHKISDPANIAVFTDYLKVGGKFLMSGCRILKSFAYYQSFPYTFPSGTFVYDYLHIYSVDETDIVGDCIGGKGKTGITTDFAVDSVKLAISPYNGKLGLVNLITKPAGFTDILYAYKNRDNSMYPSYRGRAMALRYYGTVYDAVILGFPMYFVVESDAKKMAQEILQNLHVN